MWCKIGRNLGKRPPFLQFSSKLSDFFWWMIFCSLAFESIFFLARMWQLKNRWPLLAPPRAYFYHPQLPKNIFGECWRQTAFAKQNLRSFDEDWWNTHHIRTRCLAAAPPPAFFRVKVDSKLCILWFFFTDILCNHLYLGHYAHEQNQVYETSDALSLDSPNTDCWDSMFVNPQCFQHLKHRVCLAFS